MDSGHCWIRADAFALNHSLANAAKSCAIEAEGCGVKVKKYKQ
jgi:hypothetical protein